LFGGPFSSVPFVALCETRLPSSSYILVFLCVLALALGVFCPGKVLGAFCPGSSESALDQLEKLSEERED